MSKTKKETVKPVYSTNLSSSSFSLFFLYPVFLRAKKKTKPLNLKIHSSVGSCENLPTQRSPLHTERSLRSFFFPSFIPSTPPVHAETPSASKCNVLFLTSSHSGFHDFLNAFNISLSYSNLFWHLLIWFSGYVLFLVCHSALYYVKRSGALCM